MDMKEEGPKIHPLVKAGSALTALALAACQAGSKVSHTTPEAIPTGTFPALTVEPPVGFEPSTPSGISTPEALPSLTSFETLNNARTFLESEEGAKWLPGISTEEAGLFPWNSVETWRMFSDLKSTGNEAYFVFLVPHTDRGKFSVIGVEHISGKIVLNYIDRDGSPKAISLNGQFDVKDLLGTDSEKLSEKSITVWPDLSYPNANSNGGLCTNRFRSPVPGVTDGFACSVDGKRGHYFQSQNIVTENFDGGK